MMTPGYFFLSSRPTFDIDHRSGRWSFVFFRWTAHMTTALTPASWQRRIFVSRAPMSFFVTTICTVTMEPHFVYSSSSSYMSRFLWPSSIEMCRKSMYLPYSGMGYRCCMSRSDVVKRRYHGFSYWYRKSSSMSSRTSGSPPSKLHTITEDREEERRRGDDHRRRVERKLDGLRKAENREGEHDRRHADEEDDERKQPNRRREGPSRVAAPVGEPIELREGGVR